MSILVTATRFVTTWGVAISRIATRSQKLAGLERPRGASSGLRRHLVLVLLLAAIGAGGIKLVEVTLDTPGALEAVHDAAQAEMSIGTGTVLTAEQVRMSEAAGARFVVGPALVPDVVRTALELGVEPIPGVFTATEVVRAMDLGARTLKLFPASSGGPSHLRALRGPFPAVPFLPTGGIDLDEVAGYLLAGAACVGLGGALVGPRPPASPEELDAIAARSAAVVEAADTVARGAAEHPS